MKKRVLSLFMAVTMIFSMISFYPGTASAEGEFTWEFNNGVLTVSGSGELNSMPWSGSVDQYRVKKVVLDDRITGISKTSFSKYMYLEEITMNGVISIADSTFSGISYLKTVYAENLETIGNNGFYGCSGLVNFHNSKLKTIGTQAFYNCLKLEAFPWDNVETINDYAFKNCAKLDNVTLKKVSILNNSVFYGCTSLKNISLDGVEEIGNNIFADCTSLETVTIPDSVHTLGYGVFLRCTNLKKVVIGKNASNINGGCFTGCTALTDVEISPDNEYFIFENGTFFSKDKKTLFCIIPSYLSSLTDLIIPEGVEIIASSAFASGKFASVTLPESLKEMQGSAFSGCTNITEITFGDNLEILGTYAFSGCTGLKAVYFGKGLKSIGSYAFNNCTGLTGVMAVPEGVTKIGDRAFYGCTALSEFVMPSTVTELSCCVSGSIPVFTFAPGSKIEVIETSTFSGSSPKKIIFPKSVKKLSTQCFYNTSDIEEISFELGSELEVIERQAIFYCHSFKSFTIPDKVKEIGISPISYCSSFSELKLLSEDSDFVIDNGFLINKEKKALIMGFDKNISSYTVPDYVEEIYSHCFYSLNNIKTLVIPKSVKKISSWGLYGANGLVNLTLPFIGTQRGLSGTVESVFGGVFGNLGVGGAASVSGGIVQKYAENMSGGCVYGYYVPSTLRNVTITDETVVPYGAFYNCSMLTSITLNDAIKEIKPFSFYQASGISSINIPYGVKEIGLSAFANCSKLKTINYGGNKSAWGRVCIGNNNTVVTNATKNYLGNDLVCDSPEIIINDTAGGKKVEIKSNDECFIYYTFDGSEPDVSDKLYSEELYFGSEQNLTIKAVALKYGYGQSSSSEAVINVSKLANPVSDCESGVISPDTKISLSSSDGAEIYYTTDGSEPAENGKLYTEAVHCKLPFALKAVAKKDGFVDSDVVSYKYVETYVMPEVEKHYASFTGKYSAVVNADINNMSQMCNPEINFIYFKTDAPDEKTTVSANGETFVKLTGLTELAEYRFCVEIKNGDKVYTSDFETFNTTDYEIAESISLSRTELKIPVGDAATIEAVVYPETAIDKDISWSSSASDIVYVNQKGKVFARKPGSVVITAKTESGVVAQCRVVSFRKYITGEYDFSELNMATNTRNFAEYGHDATAEGGCGILPVSYLARWDGAALESNDRYPGANSSADTGLDLTYLYKEIDADYHVQNVYFLRKRQSSTDNNDIKEAIMKYGAVSTTFYVDSKRNYYCTPYGLTRANHAVAIVGWDDTIPKERFGLNEDGFGASGDGAFICKNSWGKDDHIGGYFYISYYDCSLAKFEESFVIPELESNKNYDNIFQYDMIGPSNKLGYTGTTYAANVFPEKDKKLTKDEVLKAVSFYTTAQNMSYEIFVVPEYSDSECLAEKGEPVLSGTLKEMGYHTLDLEKDIQLKEGTRFAVIVKLSNNKTDTAANFFVESSVTNYSKATAGTDESYMSPDGTSWTDIAEKIDNTNVCIKAFTDDASSFDKLFKTPHEETNQSLALLSGIEESAQLYDEEETSDENIYTGFSYSYVGFDSYLQDPDDTRTFPEKYDLRELGQVSSVKDQHNYGTCWAFGAYASLESCLMKRASEEKENLNIIGASISYDKDTNQISVSSEYGVNLYIATYTDGKMTAIEKHYLDENAIDRKFDFNENQSAFVWDSNLIPICPKFAINQ